MKRERVSVGAYRRALEALDAASLLPRARFEALKEKFPAVRDSGLLGTMLAREWLQEAADSLAPPAAAQAGASAPAPAAGKRPPKAQDRL